MRFSPGQSVDRYVIDSLLGEGGMGEVYRARDSRLERSVALKVLRNQDSEDSTEQWEHAVMRMQREAKAVAALSHPGIVAIYDIGEHEGAPFIAMELVLGKSLRELIGTDIPLSTRLRILLDVARALAAAHEAGFVHRDIKPENILVRRDNSIKVLDFGIARHSSHNVDSTTGTLDVQGATIDSALVKMTADGALVGTPAYMAPEQLRGEPVDARADQFAWGVVAYELIASRHPFHAEKGAITLLASILGDTPEPLENVPEGVVKGVLRALEKDPAERWPSMQDIVSSWESFVTTDEIRSLPAGPTSTPKVTEVQTNASIVQVEEKRPSRLPIAAALVAMALVVTLVWFFRGRTTPPASISATPVVSAAPVATAVTDLTIPQSNSPEARAAFREGLQFIRDARWAAAVDAFGRARKADPEMAAAHFRYSLIQFSFDVPSARDAFRTALGLRASLSERDAAFLHAFEPIIQREPTDYKTAAQRFETLVAKYPLDAELLFWLGRSLNRSGTSAERQNLALEALDRCVKVDPQAADCWQTKAAALTILDRNEEALKMLDSCIALSDNVMDCLQDKLAIEASLGRCDVVVESARQLTAKDAMSPLPRRLHAEALYFTGASPTKVRNAVDQAVKSYREQKLEFEAVSMSAFLNLGYGDFAAALRDYDILVKSSPVGGSNKAKGVVLNQVSLHVELGQWPAAAAIATDSIQHFGVMPAGSSFEWLDLWLPMHSILLHAGKISRKQYDEIRADWLAKQRPTSPLDKLLLWFRAYAFPALSKELAIEALEQADLIEKPADLNRGVLAIAWASFQGKFLMVAGKPKEALPHLQRATHTCTEREPLLWYLQSLGLLGMALEDTGDTTAACQTYGKLLARWGNAKESITASKVAERAKKLKCDVTTQ